MTGDDDIRWTPSEYDDEPTDDDALSSGDAVEMPSPEAMGAGVVQSGEHWMIRTTIASMGAVALLIIGGLVLSRAQIGQSQLLEGADYARLAGIAFIAIAGLLQGAARIAYEQRYPVEQAFSRDRLVVLGAGPLVVLLLALPPVIGYAWASRIADLPFGDALVGSPGIAVAAAAAFAVGYACTGAVTVRTPVANIVAAYEAMQQSARTDRDR